MSSTNNNRPSIADLQRRMMGDPHAFFHTHAYAGAGRKNQLGSGDSSSFSQRRRTENNRKEVGSYRDAMILNDHSIKKDKKINTGTSRLSQPPVEQRRSFNSSPRVNFREPPARGFNPYA